MKNFSDLISNRRSIRKYSEKALTPEEVELILTAALKSPTSKNAKSWQYIVVEDKEQLNLLAQSKKTAEKIIQGCALAIVVLGDPITSDVWIEDASVASTFIQLQAEDLDLASCWIQIRGRLTENEQDSEEYIKDQFDVPLHMRVLSIITLGNKEKQAKPRDYSNLPWEKVHLGKYNQQ